MIDVKHLTKFYGDTPAIQDVTFHVEKGEILGFLGPNAAGKTTTMRILTSYLPPSDGTARVAGFDVFTQSLEVRKRIGYLPETVPIYPEMTVYSYLDFVARLRRVADRDTRIWEVMERLELDDWADELVGKLSKGYRQRVGLAQALVHNPEVLILDEPTIGLDPKQIIEVRKLIRELGQDHTIILSTHILPEVSQTCQRVIIINKGRIVAVDTPERLTARLKGAERIFLKLARADDGVDAALKTIKGVTTVEPRGDGAFEIETSLGVDRRADIAELVVHRGWGLLELRPMGMSLEDIFLQLTTE
jgi:ABC-2 type transport system ATP-binding protein